MHTGYLFEWQRRRKKIKMYLLSAGMTIELYRRSHHAQNVLGLQLIDLSPVCWPFCGIQYVLCTAVLQLLRSSKLPRHDANLVGEGRLMFMLSMSLKSLSL